MTAEDTVLRQLLAYPDDHLAPLDPSRIITSARRRRRTRVVAGTAGAMALTIAGLGSTLLLSGHPDSTVRPPARAGSPTASPAMTSPSSDTHARAAAACRSFLHARLPGDPSTWQSTVAPDAYGSLSVSVWTSAGARPAGSPDHVCRVVADGSGTGVHVQAVHPDVPLVLAPVEEGLMGSEAVARIVQFDVDGLTTTGARFSPDAVRIGVSSTSGGTQLDKGALVFPLLPTAPRCLSSVSLVLDVQVATGDSQFAQVAVYSSDAAGALTAGRLTADPSRASQLHATRPWGLSGPGITTGSVHIDVTSLYQAWTSGIFEGRDPLPLDTPFTVVVRPPTVGGEWSLQVGAGTQDGPRLEWTATAGCS